MLENHVMSKSCEICNNEYLEDSKYCPICGSINEKYSHSIKINEIKEDIKKSKYYELLSLKEKTELPVKVCQHCKSTVLKEDNFCPECGEKL